MKYQFEKMSRLFAQIITHSILYWYLSRIILKIGMIYSGQANDWDVKSKEVQQVYKLASKFIKWQLSAIKLKKGNYTKEKEIIKLEVVGEMMRIGVIQASSQATKNQIIYDAVLKYAPKKSEVINFGCTMEENEKYSYIEISILVGILLASRTVDFVVTGCSSGQGMMLACNSMPDVICGYAPTPNDAYLFAQINNGNAISLPLGENYTWSGTENLERTIEALFSEPFGQGYPKSEAERKVRDAEKLKKIRKIGQVQFEEFANVLDISLFESIKRKQDVIQNVKAYGKKEIADLMKWVNHSLSG